ncbi:H(+)-transporting V1 sector ATPase subunit F [Savitreella phatthalungensis]
MATAGGKDKDFRQRSLIASICDEDTTTGLLLAGTGSRGEGGSNFVIVGADPGKERDRIAEAFRRFTEEREDIAILLVNQHVAEVIRPEVDAYTKAFPALLEIPSKEHPYDPEKDSVMKRVQKLFGE